MKTRITLLFISASIHLCAEKEWHNVSYFERHDIKARINIYDPPVVMDWYKVPTNISEEIISDKLKTISLKPYFNHENYDSWKEYASKKYLQTGNISREEFDEKTRNINIENLQKLNSQFRFHSFIGSVDFKINNEIISMMIKIISEEPLTSSPFDHESNQLILQKTYTADYLKYENGQWKNHIVSNELFPPFWNFNNLPLIKDLVEAGYCYHSIAEAGLAPFDPPERLKVDSIRERYDGETLFQYPEPDARHAELHAQEPAEEPAAVSAETGACAERHHDAIDSLALKLTALYALIVTYLWRRRRA